MPAYKMVRMIESQFALLKAARNLLRAKGTEVVDQWLREHGEPPLRFARGHVTNSEIVRAGCLILQKELMK